MTYVDNVPDTTWKNTPVLVRVDVNEPVDEYGVPQSTFRIERSIPTIAYLAERGAKVILLAHLGKPDGKPVSNLTLRHIARELGHQMKRDVSFASDVYGDEVHNHVQEMAEGEILMLENTRFAPGETNNSDQLADAWAGYGKRYVNNAFATSHREHASLAAITQFVPSYAGLLIKEEVDTLDRVLDEPPSPSVAIMGGAKVETKLPLVSFFAERFDYVLVGGLVGNTYLDRNTREPGSNIYLPTDFADEERLDIGEETIEKFQSIIRKASCVFWNGPMGKIEESPFDHGTKQIMNTIMANKDCYAVAGGGETAYSIERWGDRGEFDFVSTGGGALLRYIQDGTLPALEWLSKESDTEQNV